MKNKKGWSEIILAVVICTVHFGTGFFYPLFDRHLPGLISFFSILLIPITSLVILIYLVKGIIQLIKNRPQMTMMAWTPTIIYCFTVMNSLWNPFGIGTMESEIPVSFRACYEGTQNQATILFRKDQHFELHATGVLFSSTWITGDWRRQGDTLFLQFDQQTSRLLSDTVLIEGKNLVPTQFLKDSSRNNFALFYLGDCKGEN
jgi:hypothetical protein